MNYTDEQLRDLTAGGDLRAVARLITLVENGVPRGRAILSQLYPRTGNAHVVGITGSPGAGKSTLVDRLALEWRSRNKRVAVIAIDPTSPFSGGAVLGDRIRMSKLAEHPEVFIRSMATRGSLGGTSRATIDAVTILDAAGFDVILVETVGVGQAEVDIIKTAHTCAVVLVPGMGDSVQAIKAGILEIADIFVINKSDRDGTDLVEKDLRVLLSLGEHDETSWLPPIVRAVATRGEGSKDVIDSIEGHRVWLASSDEGQKRSLRMLRDSLLAMAASLVVERIEGGGAAALEAGVRACFERRSDPGTVAEELVAFASHPHTSDP